MHFKGSGTIKNLLVKAKDRGTIWQKCGVIYRYKCGRVDCKEDYTGESGRTFAGRYKEHMKAPSPIHDHYKTTSHDISIDSFSIVGREDQSLARSIKEAIFIRVNDPSLNRNIGKYQLSHIWDKVLLCNVKQINVQIVIEQKKTVIRTIYFPASSHLVCCLQLRRKKITMIAL